MSRLARILTAFAVLATFAVAALGVQALIPKDSATKSTVRHALALFDQELAKRANAARRRLPGFPPFGVYLYRTKGTEVVSAELLSAGHSYPRTTTVVVLPASCGVRERWQPLVERWNEEDHCRVAEGSRISAVREFHAFFGETLLTAYRCRGGNAPPAGEMRKGEEWTVRCRAETGTAVSRVRVIGTETVAIAGSRVEAIHIRSEVMLEGDPEGNGQRDSWLRRSDGLLLHRVSKSEGYSDAEHGDFSERYEIELISTKPAR